MINIRVCVLAVLLLCCSKAQSNEPMMACGTSMLTAFGISYYLTKGFYEQYRGFIHGGTVAPIAMAGEREATISSIGYGMFNGSAVGLCLHFKFQLFSSGAEYILMGSSLIGAVAGMCMARPRRPQCKLHHE